MSRFGWVYCTTESCNASLNNTMRVLQVAISAGWNNSSMPTSLEIRSDFSLC
eukprot:m.426846 g.426846  ORF g.426846 m.426846 type:complete len:52 (+) comp16863_c0_seq14:994-1149(+)